MHIAVNIVSLFQEPNFPLIGKYSKRWSILPKLHLHNYVHSSFAYKIHGLEKLKIAPNLRPHRKNVVYLLVEYCQLL